MHLNTLSVRPPTKTLERINPVILIPFKIIISTPNISLSFAVLAICNLISGCTDTSSTQTEFQSEKKETVLIPINYNFNSLKLHLNSDFDAPSSPIDWRWDYMNSNNGMPDTNGIDQYMNIDQALFSFNTAKTLPTLGITTNQKKIIQFSSTTIFYLADHSEESIKNVLDSLSNFDLLRDAKIQQSIIQNSLYFSSYPDYEEMIKLVLSDHEFGYDKITYEIKLIID